jgi:hypothetical protein
MTSSPTLRQGSRTDAVRDLQTLLNASGASPPLRVDGAFGPITDAAVRDFQRRMGLTVNGIVETETWRTLRGIRPTVSVVTTPARPAAAAPRFAAVSRAQAPHVFGAPGSARATAGRCDLPFAHRLAWAPAQQIIQYRCHQLLAEVMTWVHAEAARHYGEAEYRRLRLDLWGGCFNHRPVRGGTAVSIHSYGAAVDTDPERNGLHTPTDRAALARPDYAPWWRIVDATGGRPLGRRINRDWMHWSYVLE